jgi:hypothetical protein
MEAMRSTWTDSRLDDLNDRVTTMDRKMDAGFARLDGKIDKGLGRLEDRIDKLNHTMVQGMIALISIISVLLSILVAIIATHL